MRFRAIWRRSQSKIFPAFISLIAATAALVHVLFPELAIDAVTLGFILVAVLPWLGTILKGLTLPGGFSVEYQDRVAGEVNANSLSNEREPVFRNTATLSPAALKVLKTLWKYQKLHFGNDVTKRWTFAVSHQSPHYVEFAEGVDQLIIAGLAMVDRNLPGGGQVMLTDAGIIWAKSNENTLDSFGDYYRF